MSLKETMESVVDGNKIITFKVLEGEVTKHFKIDLQVPLASKSKR